MRFAALFLLSAWLANPVTAAPTITNATGTITNGASITVTGAGFGTKGVAAPMKFDTFEGGTLGQDIGNGWSLSSNSNCGASIHNPDYSNTVLRANSTRSARARFDEVPFTCAGPPPNEDGARYSSNFGISGLPSPGFTELYMDAWAYYAPATPESRNVKLVRVHTSNSGQPNLYVNIYCYANSDGMRIAQDGGGLTAKVYNNCNNTCGPEPWHGSSWWAGNWRHLRLYLKQSGVNLSDGTIKLYTDQILDPNATNWKNRTSNTFWNAAFFGNYVGHGVVDAVCPSVSQGNTFVYWDDAYIDSTAAHVELGDASTYSSCTQIEVQPATAWSDGSLTFTLNQGAFTDLTNKYVYVTDRNGTVSNGRQITTADNTPVLTQPSNMTVSENATGDQTITATDADLQPLTFSLVSGPTYSTVTTVAAGAGTGTGNIHLAPGYLDSGTASMTCQASDGVNVSQKTISILVNNTNRAPSLNFIDNMIAAVSSPSTQYAFATDPDGDNITFSEPSGFSFISVSAATFQGGFWFTTITFAPGGGDAPGLYTVTIRASDGTANTDRNFTAYIIADPTPETPACTPF